MTEVLYFEICIYTKGSGNREKYYSKKDMLKRYNNIFSAHFFMYTWSLDLFNNASGARSIQYGLSVGKTGKKSLISGSGF